jgi:hypothetical protein
VTSDAMNIDSKYLDDDLSSTIDTEILIKNNLVPDGLLAFGKASA